jgi:hypothetical protein
MKKFLVSVCVILHLTISSLYATTAEDDKNIVQYFSDGVANSIYKTAWPTATYKDVELLDSEDITGGYKVQIKFKGNSNMCMIGTCPLWFILEIKMDLEYSIKDMYVLKHNAIVQPPFKTSGAIASAILEANSN